MNTLVLLGQKGGVGKTQIGQNLAVAACRDRKQRAVIIDTDAQTTASSWGDRRQAERPSVVSCQSARLRFAVEEARRKGAGWVFIDTPATQAEANLEAVRLSDLILVPVAPAVSDLETLPALRDVLHVAGKLECALVIVNNAPHQGDRHVHAQETARELGFMACEITLYRRAAYLDAPLAGLGVLEHEPGGKAAEEIARLYAHTKTLLHAHTKTPLDGRTEKKPHGKD